MTLHLKKYNPRDSYVLITNRTDIAQGDLFTHGGEEWFAITGSVGYTLPGFPTIRAGMITDPDNPLPDTAITTVRLRDVELFDDEETT